jgi:glycosyltransferase involved in cell wall biosynthesis
MRLAFVVQRYGIEVTGGAESLCRWVAERMQKYFEVEVLTTCALDYLTWENHYPSGTTTVNSVNVRRFPTDYPRNMKKFNGFANPLISNNHRTLADELNWIHLQGPYSSALLTYIKEHEEQFDLFIFVTYSYLTTFLGLQLVPRKSILIPAAHDEPHFHFTAFQPIFHLPLGIIYNTNEERRLVHDTWQNEQVPSCVAGVGLSQNNQDGHHFQSGVHLPLNQRDQDGRHLEGGAHLPLNSTYLLYVGRVDVMKGCRELISYFLKYLDERSSDLHLVLIGKHVMDIPKHPKIHALGVLSDTQKDEAIRQAALVVNPSEYESLSLLILESWQLEIPVLVNGRSDVLAEHCLASDGGLYYTNYDEFALCVDILLSNKTLREAMGIQGRKYVEQHYSWDNIEKTYINFITEMIS